MNKILKSLDNNRLYIVIFAILFVISGIFAFKGFYTMFPIISHQGRGALTYLPTILLFVIPLITLSFLFVYKHKMNPIKKHKILKYYSFTLFVVSFFGFFLQLINMFITFGWNNIGKNISSLFPYDVLIILGIIFALSIYLLIYSFKTIEEEKNDVTIEEKLKNKNIALFIVYLVFTSYFFGAGMHAVNLIKGGISDTWYLSLPFVLILFIMSMNGVFYLIYKHKKENKKLYLLFMIISLSLTVLLVGYGIVSANIEPRIISLDLTPLFYLDHSSSLPIAGIFLFVGIVIPEIIALIKLIIFLSKKDK